MNKAQPACRPERTTRNETNSPVFVTRWQYQLIKGIGHGNHPKLAPNSGPRARSLLRERTLRHGGHSGRREDSGRSLALRVHGEGCLLRASLIWAMSMSNTQGKQNFCGRLDAIGRELETLRRCRTLGVDADPAGEELAEFERHHVDLRRRSAQIEAADKPDQPAIDALEADLRGLSDAVRRWIQRQDAKIASS